MAENEINKKQFILLQPVKPCVILLARAGKYLEPE
jgi:hypothetical protein